MSDIRSKIKFYAILEHILELLSGNIPPYSKSLNMIIPIVIHFCSIVSKRSIASRIKPHAIQQNVT